MFFSNKWEKARAKCSVSLFACFLTKIYSIEITQTETDSLSVSTITEQFPTNNIAAVSCTVVIDILFNYYRMLTTSHYEKNADEVSLLFTFHKLPWREKSHNPTGPVYWCQKMSITSRTR